MCKIFVKTVNLNLSAPKHSLKTFFLCILHFYVKDNNGADEIETYNYTEADFITHVTPWETAGSKSEVSKVGSARFLLPLSDPSINSHEPISNEIVSKYKKSEQFFNKFLYKMLQ